MILFKETVIELFQRHCQSYLKDWKIDKGFHKNHGTPNIGEEVDIVFLILITFILKTCLLITLVTLSSLDDDYELTNPIITDFLLRPILLILIVTCLQILKSILLVSLITSYANLPPLSALLFPSIFFVIFFLRTFLFATIIFHFYYWKLLRSIF